MLCVWWRGEQSRRMTGGGRTLLNRSGNRNGVSSAILFPGEQSFLIRLSGVLVLIRSTGPERLLRNFALLPNNPNDCISRYKWQALTGRLFTLLRGRAAGGCEAIAFKIENNIGYIGGIRIGRCRVIGKL